MSQGTAKRSRDDLTLCAIAKRLSLRRSALLLGISLCCQYQSAQSPSHPPYRTAASILALTPQEAQRGAPVILRGVVTCSTEFSLYIQDRTAGIWVDWHHPTDFVPGDEVEAKGHTAQGLFSPQLVGDSIRKIGHAALPPAKKVTLKQLLTGNEDAQYVRITGVVRSVGIHQNVAPAARVWLKIAVDDGFIYATLPEDAAAFANKLIDATVRIEATASVAKTPNRQLTSALLIIPTIHNVKVVDPPPRNLFAAPTIPIERLLQYRSGTDSDHRVHVTGTVTYYHPGENLVIEEDGRGLLAMSAQLGDIKPGDQVDIVGFPTPSPSGPYLEDAIFRLIGHGPMPTPAPTTIANLESGKFNYNLISIEGKLLQRITEPSRQVLLLQNGSSIVQANLDETARPGGLTNYQEGSILRIAGICILAVEGSWNEGGGTSSVVHFSILIRSPHDVVETNPPSWWTTAHLIYVAVTLGILMCTFFALTIYGRIKHWRLEAVMQERERMASEIHDTLAQSFAGIGFKLQAIRRAVPSTLPELRDQVDSARALVRYSHKEARRSLEPDHWTSLDNADLLDTLEASARRLIEGGAVTVSVTRSGRLSYSLPAKVNDALLHIGQEAIANAVRHADPNSIIIGLIYEHDVLRLSVCDDGCGFVDSGSLLGFGLRGMRRRAAAISASFNVVSTVGRGTRVEVVCPLVRDGALLSNLTRRVISRKGDTVHGQRR